MKSGQERRKKIKASSERLTRVNKGKGNQKLNEERKRYEKLKRKEKEKFHGRETGHLKEAIKTEERCRK